MMMCVARFECGMSACACTCEGLFIHGSSLFAIILLETCSAVLKNPS